MASVRKCRETRYWTHLDSFGLIWTHLDEYVWVYGHKVSSTCEKRLFPLAVFAVFVEFIAKIVEGARELATFARFP